MTNEPSPTTSYTGVVTSIFYHDAAGGYTVAELTPESGAAITAVGVLPGVVVGENLRVHGHWESHKQYGRQFRIENYELVRPSTANGIIAYLSGGLVKGIGPKLAASLVSHFGEEVLEVLDAHPERLREVSGIGKVRAEELARSWAEHKEVHRIMLFLQEHGAGPTLAGRIYQRYGSHAMTVIEREPYRLAREVRGIGFLTADRMARAAGISPQDPQRLQAGLLHVLTQAVGEGHFFLPREQLLQEAQRVLQCERQILEQALTDLVGGGEVAPEAEAGDEAGYYLKEMLEGEKELAGLLLALGEKQLAHAPAVEQTRQWLSRRETMGARALTENQAAAVAGALRQPITVITGGPGTGKTTITRALAEACAALSWRVALCSPTGRAAKRLSQLSGQPASTIHRLLAWDPVAGHFRFNAAERLPIDMLIVDEASMVDAILARDLLQAVPPGARIVFIGDADQLPSVGPGNFLRDLIASEVFPVYRLTEIFRQEEGGEIVINAHCIRRGEMPQIVRGSKWQGEDCVLMERATAEEAAAAVIKVITRSLPRLGYEARDIQVITPMHRGPAGVTALNQALQEALNPPGLGRVEVRRGDQVFREGDRVMQTENDYDKNVYNGDIGRLERIDSAAKTVVVQFEHAPVVYDFGELDELQLAYALTVHKSQGSEYPAVVMVIHSTHYIMLRRNLLYTALTRAEKMAVLIGDTKGLWKAVRTATEAERYTHLAARLRGGQRHTGCKDERIGRITANDEEREGSSEE